MALLPKALAAGGGLVKGALGLGLGGLAIGGGVLGAESYTDDGQGGVVLRWAQNQAKKLIETSSTEQGRNAVIDGYYGGIAKFAGIGGWVTGLLKFIGLDSLAEKLQGRFESSIGDINQQAVDFKNSGDVFDKAMTPKAQASLDAAGAKIDAVGDKIRGGLNKIGIGADPSDPTAAADSIGNTTLLAGAAAGTYGLYKTAKFGLGKLFGRGGATPTPSSNGSVGFTSPGSGTPGDAKSAMQRDMDELNGKNPDAKAADSEKPKVKGGKLGRLFVAVGTTAAVATTAMTYSPQSHAAGSIDPNKAADIPQTGTEYLKQEGGSQVFEVVTDAIPFGEAVKSYMDGNTAKALDSAVADTAGLAGAFAAGAAGGALFGGVGAIPGALIAGGGYMAGEYIGDKLGDATITEAVADKFDSVADAAGTKLAEMKGSFVNWFNKEADPTTTAAMDYKQSGLALDLN